MEKAVIQDWGQFTAYLAAQPLCLWAAQKEVELRAMGMPLSGNIIQPSSAKSKNNDNDDLMAALASMA